MLDKGRLSKNGITCREAIPEKPLERLLKPMEAIAPTLRAGEFWVCGKMPVHTFRSAKRRATAGKIL